MKQVQRCSAQSVLLGKDLTVEAGPVEARGPEPRRASLPALRRLQSALAAADFSAFVDFGLLRTFDAALAAFAPVCRVFRAM